MTPFPITEALRDALEHAKDARQREDLMFLERWECEPLPGSASALRILQLRRANPELVVRIRAELAARAALFRSAPRLDQAGRPGL